MNNIQKKSFSFLSLTLCVSLLVACGQESFNKQFIQRNFTPGVELRVEPKVDIVLFQDVSGSMAKPHEVLQKKIESFIKQINKSWDFHFIVLPLQYRETNIARKYVIATDCSQIQKYDCLEPDNASRYKEEGGLYDPSESTGVGGSDKGFENMRQALSESSSLNSSGFLRQDALLVVIPFTNGNDTTGVPFEDRGDGTELPNFSSQKAERSLEEFYTFLKSIRSSSKLNFYAVASRTSTIRRCHGTGAYAGSRYQEIANKINSINQDISNGAFYNICSDKELNSALENISSQMVATKKAIHFNFVALPTEPDLETLNIYKNGKLLPANSKENGWTPFLDKNQDFSYQKDKDSSYEPAGNKKSGYFIELHGTAKYTGQDNIRLEYEPI